MKAYIADAFTDKPFKGNPAAVCFPDKAINDKDMLSIAREFGLSETAFVQKTDKTATWHIRFFSPRQEIPLCGHATLATAKIIFEQTDLNEIHFINVEKLDLPIRRHEDEIILEFPVYETTALAAPDNMLEALGIKKMTNSCYSPKNKIIIIEISSTETLAALQPDFNALVNSYKGINGVLVTAAATDNVYDFHYRYFWPWAGTNEDPVTGGVQTFLTRYWALKTGRNRMKAFQSSARTGFMTVELRENKVLIFGQARIILEGHLNDF